MRLKDGGVRFPNKTQGKVIIEEEKKGPIKKKLSMEKRCNSDNLSEARVLNQATLLKYTPCIAGVEIEKEKERERKIGVTER